MKDWQPTAYSPLTHLLYIPHQHLCMDYKTSEVGYIAGTPYVGATVDMYAGPGGYRGEFAAWDRDQAQEGLGDPREVSRSGRGTMVTAGNIAVYGTLDRWFKIVDARDGKLLYQFHAPSGFIGQPITYQGSDGKQYIAILDGVGGWPGAIANAEIDPRVRNGAAGLCRRGRRSSGLHQWRQRRSWCSRCRISGGSNAPCTEIALLTLLLSLAPLAGAQAAALRVCADPNNLPFSNRAGQGFENKIAELVARRSGQNAAIYVRRASTRVSSSGRSTRTNAMS